MEQENKTAKHGIYRLTGTIVLAAAILIGCAMLAQSFANNYYSSGGSPFPSEITARIDSIDSDYLDERHAANYIGLHWSSDWGLLYSLINSGALDGTFIVFDPPIEEIDGYAKEGVVRVFSKARLDDWMEARFAGREG